ncbi:MAG: redoxin domain-containing protein [Planctomycetes bacterium]|nr:redoxin domain-containing protein [Planctomycetota bacterium]
MMRVSNRVIRLLLLSAIGLLCGLSCVCVQASEVELTFFGWSDQHVKPDGNAEHLLPAIYTMNMLPGFDYPEEIGGKVAIPSFVLNCGDITEQPTHAAKDMYETYITRGLRYPSFDVAGNHDLGGESPGETVTDWLISRHGALSYTFDIEGAHFVMVLSEYDESLNGPARPIGKSTLDFIRSDLESVPKNTPVVVATHLCYDAIANKDEFVDALKDANVLCVFGGHHHKAKVDTYRGINFVQLPSPASGSPSEFTVIRITDDRLIAVPFDYASRRWAAGENKILDAKIKGPLPPETIKEPKDLKIGQSAPDFMLPGVDNRYYRLKDFENADVLVVIFTCNHCPTAQAYEDRIIQLAAYYKDKSVALVAISPNDPLAVRLDELGYSDLSDSFDEMKIRAYDKKFNFPYLYDGDNQRASRAYNPATTPHAFVFDKARKLRYVGRIDNSQNKQIKSRDLRNAVDALLANKPVPVETTRPFGCSTKWSSKRKNAQEAFYRWAKETVTLDTIDEEGVKKLLANDTQKLRLVNLWATWCGPCAMEFGDLMTINRMYRKRDFEMVTLSSDKPYRQPEALSFLKKRQASCTNYIFEIDDLGKLSKALDGNWSGAIPLTLIIKPGGEIIYKHEGIIEPLTVRKIIVEHLGRFYK